MQFGLQVVARQTITASAVAGARTAARGGNKEDVTKTVAKTLATDKIALNNKANTIVVIERFGEEPKSAGNTKIRCRPFGPELREGEVRVTVCVLGGRRGSPRIPNWLGFLARPMSPRRIQSSTLLTVE